MAFSWYRENVEVWALTIGPQGALSRDPCPVNSSIRNISRTFRDAILRFHIQGGTSQLNILTVAFSWYRGFMRTDIGVGTLDRSKGCPFAVIPLLIVNSNIPRTCRDANFTISRVAPASSTSAQ